MATKLDIKDAFLQNKDIERILFVYPQKREEKFVLSGTLNKIVYELADTSCNQYLKVY